MHMRHQFEQKVTRSRLVKRGKFQQSVGLFKAELPAGLLDLVVRRVVAHVILVEIQGEKTAVETTSPAFLVPGR